MYLSPAAAAGVSAGDAKAVSKNQAKVSAEDKISSQLTKKFKSEEKVTFLVKLKEQADTQKVAKEIDKQAKSKKLTQSKTKQLKQSAVITELKATAAKTQPGILKFAEEQKALGKVSDIQPYYISNMIAITGTKDVMEKIASFAEVEKILSNEKRKLFTTDVKDAEITNTEWGVNRVGAPEVWGMGIDGTGVVVGILDTGVQWDHPALKEKYLGYNAATGEVNHNGSFFDPYYGETVPYDDNGHGTHVAGTILGSEPDGSNQVGVAPGAKFIMAKAFDSAGYGYDEEILAAFEWIMDQAPDIVSNSWGGGPGLDETYRETVQNLRAAGIAPVFAAGNTDESIPVPYLGSVSTPANFPESIAVGSTTSTDALSSFSLWGPSPYGEIKPDVAAPGSSIRSSLPGSGYGGASGTSMATPHVSGVIALLLQANSSLSVDDIHNILKSTADPLTNATFPETPNNGFGYGMVDAVEAVSSNLSGIGKITGNVTTEGEDSEAPAISHESPGETYGGLATTLQATVSDNISIVEVAFEYEKDGSVVSLTPTRLQGNYKGGTYQVTIPSEDVTEGELVYSWKATDFGGNVTSEEFTLTVLAAPSVGYSNDFESNVNGWNTDTPYAVNNTWEWGVPVNGPGAAHSGEKVWATDLDGTYLTDSYSTLEAPPIYIPEEGAILEFASWHYLENGWDYGYLTLTDDGGENWYLIDDFTGQSGGWQVLAYDLSEYAGKTVNISFDVEADWLINYDGWYIDDFSILPVAENGALSSKSKVQQVKAKPFDKAAKVSKADIQTAAETDGSSIMALPVSATVSVLETGVSTATNPANGEYSMLLGAGEYTLVAESYGYHPAQQTVTVEEDVTSTANFVLEEIAKGTVSGQITNSQTGNPIAGATVFVVEDAKVAPVVTDENGNFTLEAYEGNYTLKVVAPYYFDSEASVTIEGGANAEQNFSLDPFIGYGGEIGYDDGTAENAIAWNDGGNGFAVKMSLAEGADRALVTGGQFMFWTTEWPVPGGNEFQVAVYDASGVDGAPGNMIAGPFDATTLRDGNWTNVDLSDKGIVVNGDFYMVYIQNHPNPNTPGIAIDESSPLVQGRSWEYFGGVFTEITSSSDFPGNYMIRASVEYEVDIPVISSPSDGAFTNESVITVEGSSAPNMDVKVFNNGEEVASGATNESGDFAIDVALSEGENVLTARASSDRGMTAPSEAVTVYLDQDAPELAITSPADGLKTNKEVIEVKGTVADQNLETVKVNGQNATVTNGEFSKRILLDSGVNTIEVVATDKAGNSTTQTVTIEVDFDEIEISNLQPAEDMSIFYGDTVTISFEAEEGLSARYQLNLPLTNTNGVNNIQNSNQFVEVSPGYYEATYTAGLVAASGVEIEVIVNDAFGNENRFKADGKLTINIFNSKYPELRPRR